MFDSGADQNVFLGDLLASLDGFDLDRGGSFLVLLGSSDTELVGSLVNNGVVILRGLEERGFIILNDQTLRNAVVENGNLDGVLLALDIQSFLDCGVLSLAGLLVFLTLAVNLGLLTDDGNVVFLGLFSLLQPVFTV